MCESRAVEVGRTPGQDDRTNQIKGDDEVCRDGRANRLVRHNPGVRGWPCGVGGGKGVGGVRGCVTALAQTIFLPTPTLTQPKTLPWGVLVGGGAFGRARHTGRPFVLVVVCFKTLSQGLARNVSEGLGAERAPKAGFLKLGGPRET
jgi:hypothetical protein